MFKSTTTYTYFIFLIFKYSAGTFSQHSYSKILLQNANLHILRFINMFFRRVQSTMLHALVQCVCVCSTYNDQFLKESDSKEIDNKLKHLYLDFFSALSWFPFRPAVKLPYFFFKTWNLYLLNEENLLVYWLKAAIKEVNTFNRPPIMLFFYISDTF